MTEREKIAHLLRRFGLGAGKYQEERHGGGGLTATIDRLLYFERVDEEFSVSPWEHCAEPNGMLYFDPYRFASWWSLRLLMTERPLQEKLTLFWHDHFAVSGAKVFDGPSMLNYLEVLRKHGTGNFTKLLTEVSKSPAMLFYLDGQNSTKEMPNENFAREVLELFTVGRGNYTEKDIQETSRAMTGWGIYFGGLGSETPYEKQIEHAAKRFRSVYSFCAVPENHDSGSKTILGKTLNFTPESALEFLGNHPATGKHITTKLWEFFAYSDPEPAVRSRLEKAWVSSNGNITAVLKAIMNSPEFFTERSVRSRPKSPVDFTVAMMRQLDLGTVARALRGKGEGPFKPMRKEVKGAADLQWYFMTIQGMSLLFPPDVGGWQWGQAWISSSNVTKRIQHADVFFFGEDPSRPIAMYLADKIKKDFQPKSTADLVGAFCSIFDAQLSPEKLAIVTAACEKAGGLGAFANKDSTAAMLAATGKVLFAAPEYHMC